MKISILCARTQIVHFGHMQVISNALNETDKLIIILGSSKEKPTKRNPFSFHERKKCIERYMQELELDSNRVFFEAMCDYTYNDLKWETEVRKVVSKYTKNNDCVYLTGYKKDGSSYYLSMFPEWRELPFTKFVRNLSSTGIRNDIAAGKLQNHKDNISTFMYNEFENPNSEYSRIIRETNKENSSNKYIVHEQVNVIVSSGHVLLNINNDTNRFKLPSSLLEFDETVQETSVSSILSSDTQLNLTKNIINARRQRSHFFDDPYRSETDRVIAQGIYYTLVNQSKLPKISKNSAWVPLHELKRKNMDDDHFYIVKYFTGY